MIPTDFIFGVFYGVFFRRFSSSFLATKSEIGEFHRPNAAHGVHPIVRSRFAVFFACVFSRVFSSKLANV